MTATCVLWVRAFLNCEPLFSFLDGLHVSIRHSFWMSEQSIEVNTCDMGEDMGHTVKEVKTPFRCSTIPRHLPRSIYNDR